MDDDFYLESIEFYLLNRMANRDPTTPWPKHRTFFSNIICGNCNRQGHSLRNCVGPVTARGDINGCPYCNTTEHIWDCCRRYNEMEMFNLFPESRRMEAFKYFFHDLRTNKPPIRTSYNLWLFVLGLPDQPRYPWSLEFSKNQASDPMSIVNIELVYTEGDYTSNIVDPATYDLRTISRNIDFSLPIGDNASRPNLLTDAFVHDEIPGSSVDTLLNHFLRTIPPNSERWRNTFAVFAASYLWTQYFNTRGKPNWATDMFLNVIQHNIAGPEFLFRIVLESKRSWS